MPASRSALAMILAPRSCPSSPGLAITTRILRLTGSAVYGDAIHRRWLLPGLAEPRQRTFGVPGRRRRAAPARLRAGGAGQASRTQRRVAERRLDRRHALAPRPLGRSGALGLGDDVRARPGP